MVFVEIELKDTAIGKTFDRPGSNGSPLDYFMLLSAAVIYGAVFTSTRSRRRPAHPPGVRFLAIIRRRIGAWVVLTLRGERLGVRAGDIASYIVIGALVIGCRFHC